MFLKREFENDVFIHYIFDIIDQIDHYIDNFLNKLFVFFDKLSFFRRN